MILATVGTHTQGFNRLVIAIDELAAGIEEEIIIQSGNSDYKPVNAKHFSFTSSQEMEQLFIDARIVITHAGSGSIFTCLLHQKKMIVVPRLAKYKEHFDNHQIQLAKAMEKEGKAVCLIELSQENIRNALMNTIKINPGTINNRSLIEALKMQLDVWNELDS